MTDHQIALWTLSVGVLGTVGTWLAVPQIQKWRKLHSNSDDLITLGNLGTADPYQVPLAPGVIEADRQTLGVIIDAFAKVDIGWLRTYDFGGSFRWSEVENVCDYALRHGRPEHEFIDKELEEMRYALMAATINFSHLVVRYTSPIFRDDEVRQISREYEHGQLANARFSEQSQEINEAADIVCTAYTDLVRRARMKLAMSTAEVER